jgi:hypothetical protein
MKPNEERDKLLNSLNIIWMEEIEKMVIKPKLPKDVKGMIILGIIPNFPIDPISWTKYMLSDYDNPARQESIKKAAEYIMEIATLMREGKWEPEHHVPPTIEWMFGEKFKYLTGHMTKKGAYAADKKDLWIVVVDFVDEDGFDANYWREIWASNENIGNNSYVKLERTPEDVVIQVVEMVEKHIIKIDDDVKGKKPTVSRTLDDMQLTDQPKAEILAKIMIKLGYKHLAVEPKTADEVQKEVIRHQMKYPNHYFAGASYSAKSQEKRDLEVARKFREKFNSDPYTYNADTCIGLVGVAGKGCQKIKEVRTHKELAQGLPGIVNDREEWRKTDDLEKATGMKFGWKSKNIKQILEDPDMIDLNE